jgi:hypothetical protein
MIFKENMFEELKYGMSNNYIMFIKNLMRNNKYFIKHKTIPVIDLCYLMHRNFNI